MAPSADPLRRWLVGLGWLSLAGLSLGDEGLEHLQELDRLRVLVLFQTEVSDEAVARLKQALPEVHVLK